MNNEIGTEWQLLYEDTFDRETPRAVEASGHDLQAGLVQLWARHLYETVQADGGRGFARFNLWLPVGQKSIAIEGDWPAQVRLRKWVFGREGGGRLGYEADHLPALLESIAKAHCSLIRQGQTSQVIFSAVQSSARPDDFYLFLRSLD